ncbi:gamma-glutamylcyclotransferase, partial [Francisella tularensis subsp. holarctica]|nr:gamma-glutamylcyclotransferase [Francisella tularensis subsp. holarctica]
KKTENILDEVHGTVYELTTNEIKLSVKYEVDSYVRKKVTLKSGNSAWIYT